MSQHIHQQSEHRGPTLDQPNLKHRTTKKFSTLIQGRTIEDNPVVSLNKIRQEETQNAAQEINHYSYGQQQQDDDYYQNTYQDNQYHNSIHTTTLSPQKKNELKQQLARKLESQPNQSNESSLTGGNLESSRRRGGGGGKNRFSRPTTNSPFPNLKENSVITSSKNMNFPSTAATSTKHRVDHGSLFNMGGGQSDVYESSFQTAFADQVINNSFINNSSNNYGQLLDDFNINSNQNINSQNHQHHEQSINNSINNQNSYDYNKIYSNRKSASIAQQHESPQLELQQPDLTFYSKEIKIQVDPANINFAQKSIAPKITLQYGQLCNQAMRKGKKKLNTEPDSPLDKSIYSPSQIPNKGNLNNNLSAMAQSKDSLLRLSAQKLVLQKPATFSQKSKLKKDPGFAFHQWNKQKQIQRNDHSKEHYQNKCDLNTSLNQCNVNSSFLPKLDHVNRYFNSQVSNSKENSNGNEKRNLGKSGSRERRKDLQIDGVNSSFVTGDDDPFSTKFSQSYERKKKGIVINTQFKQVFTPFGSQIQAFGSNSAHRANRIHSDNISINNNDFLKQLTISGQFSQPCSATPGGAAEKVSNMNSLGSSSYHSKLIGFDYNMRSGNNLSSSNHKDIGKIAPSNSINEQVIRSKIFTNKADMINQSSDLMMNTSSYNTPVSGRIVKPIKGKQLIFAPNSVNEPPSQIDSSFLNNISKRQLWIEARKGGASGSLLGPQNDSSINSYNKAGSISLQNVIKGLCQSPGVAENDDKLVSRSYFNQPLASLHHRNYSLQNSNILNHHHQVISPPHQAGSNLINSFHQHQSDQYNTNNNNNTQWIDEILASPGSKGSQKCLIAFQDSSDASNLQKQLQVVKCSADQIKSKSQSKNQPIKTVASRQMPKCFRMNKNQIQLLQQLSAQANLEVKTINKDDSYGIIGHQMAQNIFNSPCASRHNTTSDTGLDDERQRMTPAFNERIKMK